MSAAKVVALTKKPVTMPPVDPARAALAAAIEQLAPFAADIEAASSGLSKARDSLREAESRLYRARGDLQEARANQTARSVAAAARGEGPEPDAALRDARRAEADASDDVEIAQAIVETLQTALNEAGYAAKRAKSRVEEAAKSVILAEVPRLRAWVLEAQAEHARRGEILAFAVGLNSWSNYDVDRNNLASFASHHASIAGSRDDAFALPWRDALDALKLDAFAPLPPTGAAA